MAGRPGTAGAAEQASTEQLLFSVSLAQAFAEPGKLPVPLAPAPVTARNLHRSPAAVDLFRQHPLARGPVGWLAMAMADEADRGTAFLFAPIAIGIGILVYFEAAAEPSLLVLAAATLIGATAALALRRLRFLSLPAAAVCLIGFGASLAHFETWRRAGAVLGSEVTTRITGRIEAVEQLASGRIRLTLRLLSSAHPALSHPPDRVRVSTRALPAAAEPGSVVGGLVHLRPPTGPVRPGSFDFAFDSFFEGLGATGFFLGPPQLEPEPETDAEQSWLWRLDAAAERVRDAMAGRIRARIGGVEGEIAAALVVGVRAGIPEDVNEALRRTGLAHVLSISGLHMALVAATVMGAIRFGLALLPGVAARWPVKKFAAGGALLALAVYLAVSGYAVAAERSFIMLAIMLVAVIFDRAALTLRNVALAALAVEAWTPHEVVGPSFQMSFAATVALVGAYGWVTRRTAHGGPAGAVRGLPARLLSATARHGIGLALTSLVAGAATAVYGIYHFGRVAPLSLPTNLVAMPVVSALVMPAAVVAVALMPLGWDGPALDAMGKGLAWMTGVAEWFSARSPLDGAGVAPVGAVLSITAALLFATLFSGRLRWLAVPLAAAGLAGFALRAAPDVLVAEDGRLVAFALPDHSLAVSRTRPSAFLVKDWQRALLTDRIVRPGNGLAGPNPEAADPMPDDTGFRCEAGLCMARHLGFGIATAATQEAAAQACGPADLLVVSEPAAGRPCSGREVVVITARDLARHGGAAITLRQGSVPRIGVRFAIAEPFRPWHLYRQFSRAARGLAARPQPKDLARGGADASRSPASAEDDDD